MKNIIVLFFALAIAATAQAQTESRYRTDVSVRSQYVNNNLPGAVYAPPAVKSAKTSNGAQPQSIGAQIKGNAVPGVQYKTSNSGGGSAAAQQPATSGSGLASDKKAEKTEARKMPEAPKNLTQ